MYFQTEYSERPIYKLSVQFSYLVKKNIKIFIAGNIVFFFGFIVVGFFNDILSRDPVKIIRNYFFYFFLAFETIYIIYKPLLTLYKVLKRRISNKYPNIILTYDNGSISFQHDEGNLGLVIKKIEEIKERKRNIEIAGDKKTYIVVPKSAFKNNEWKEFDVKS